MTHTNGRRCRTKHLIGGALVLVATLLLLGSNINAPAQANFATLTTDGVWTWYNDPRAIFHNGTLYYGYVKANGKSALSAFSFATGNNTELWNSGFTQVDDHNNPGLLAKQDGTLLAIYSRHISDQYFAYRRSNSTNPVTPAGWFAEQAIPNSGAGMTYANPFQLSAESGKIYNFCRNQNFNPTIYTSEDGGNSWSAPQHFISAGTGGSVRPYVKYASDYTGRIDFLYTDGHPRDVNNSLYHMFYTNGAFYKTDGALVKNYANLPILHDSGERGSVIYQYNASPQSDPNQWIPAGRAWCWEVANDTNDVPVCVFTVQNDFSPVGQPDPTWTDDRIYYYYARWTGSAWQKRFIAHAGRPIYSAEDDYAGGICVDPQDPNVIYISSNAQDPFNLSETTNVPLRANNRYELWRGVTTDGGLNFSWTQITTNSAQDNLRPYIPRRNGGEPCVIWFRGTYSTYSSYNCSVVGLFTSLVAPPLPINYVDASSGALGNTRQWDANSQSWITFSPPLNIASTADNQWEEESGAGLGNGPTSNWFESNREGTENCPQLRTSVEGLMPGTYNVFAYFWVANGQGFKFGAALTNNPGGSLPLYTMSSFGVQPAKQSSFGTNTVMVTSGDRTLYQVSLGTVTGSTVNAYIDDEANGGYSSSCWYDGIGYQLQLAQTSTNLSVQLNADDVIVAWPESHRGWLLQSTSNPGGIWMDVEGSSTNTSHEVAGSTQPSEFFRLRYPLP